MTTIDTNTIDEISALILDTATQLQEYLEDATGATMLLSQSAVSEDKTISEMAKIIIQMRNATDEILRANNMG